MIRHTGALPAVLGIALAILSVGATSPPKDDGFLDEAEFDVVPALQPAPRAGDPRYESDRRIFRATRRLAGTARWAMAVNDADESVPSMVRDFSCALGVTLTPRNAPKLAALVVRAGHDTAAQTRQAKMLFRRNRPFMQDRGPVCQPIAALYDPAIGRTSYDYPSGHTTWGWTWALVLSAVAPDRATAILARGRAYGDSRYICGAHNESAVEAGMQSASATMAVVATKPAYRNALAEAGQEIAALRRNSASPPAGQCQAEAAMVRTTTPVLRRPR